MRNFVGKKFFLLCLFVPTIGLGMLSLVASPTVAGDHVIVGEEAHPLSADSVQPEGATPGAETPILSPALPPPSAPVVSHKSMVVAAHPLAVAAGQKILADGGTAADAAIAVQLVLGLVEPQSSGIGGGALVLYYDAAKGKVESFDGRETAPRAADPFLFLDSNSEPLPFMEAVVSARSVGTPGLVRLLETLHQRHGKKAWRKLFQPAIALARKGFAMSPRLAALIRTEKEHFKKDAEAFHYFYNKDEQPFSSGHVLRNAAYADTLQQIARSGAKAFYQGKIAKGIVAKVKSAQVPGRLALSDLAAYEVKEREPLCMALRQRQVCGMGPPSSGGIAVAQILGMLETSPISTWGPRDPRSWRLFGEAMQLAFADRQLYVADPDFVAVPAKELIDPSYLAQRASLLRASGPRGEPISAGKPPWRWAQSRVPAKSFDLPSTSHISIVDSWGNAVSMTSSIENAFGSRLMTQGFFLNNQLTDFSFAPAAQGSQVANRVEPAKRPRSSMSPTIVLDDKAKLYAVVGSPGGSRIIAYVAKTLLAHLYWGMNIKEAVEVPNVVNQDGTFELEDHPDGRWLQAELEKDGFKVKIGTQISGLHGIVLRDGQLQGAADSRREGIAQGEETKASP